MSKPYALLRAGFPFHATLGMRRVTTYPMDLAFGDDGMMFVLCRNDGEGGDVRRTNWDDDDLGTFGSGFMWPVQIIRDRDEKLYISDEGNHTISIWDRDGKQHGSWGRHGSGDGELNRPSGIMFDADGNMLVADTLNHRIQRFTPDGTFLSKFGSHGSGAGELDMPWGVAVDDENNILVADWHNNRIQKFAPDGTFIMQFGRPGSGEGELKGPAGITVDQHGDIYVADRGNHRILQFDHTGRYVDRFIGDATLSKSGRIYIMANPKVLRAREMTTLEESKRLRGPDSVRFGDDGFMYIPDFGSHRIQVYRKEAYELTDEQIWAEQKSPFLYTV
ncbi:MAG: NHL repeat-containing protein [Dehalococcoidia bacterium]